MQEPSTKYGVVEGLIKYSEIPAKAQENVVLKNCEI
jgi:hypothetical protein